MRALMTALAVGWLLYVPLPHPADAQAVPVLIESAPLAARAIRVAWAFLSQYAAGKALDELLGEGRDVQRGLAALDDRLTAEANRSAANRSMILRQQAVIADLSATITRLVAGPPITNAEAEAIERRLTGAIEELEKVQEDHGRRIGRLEEGLDSLREALRRRDTAAPPPSASQMLGPVKVTAANVQRTTSGTVIVTLLFENQHTRGVAFAFKDPNSGGIADFWKFFASAGGSLTDEVGTDYRLDKASGFGFARTSDDWTVIAPSQSSTVTVSFTGGPSAGVSRYDLSLDLWMALRDSENEPVHTSAAVVSLRGLR